MSFLVLNCGSSSIKVTLYGEDSGEVIHHSVTERVTDHRGSLAGIFQQIQALLPGGLSSLRAVGHRVVHGGRRFRGPVIIDEDVLAGIRGYAEIAPLHNPPNIMGIEESARMAPEALQVAVFDTSFHSAIPSHAHNYAIPMELAKKHRIRRYGFHGISHQYIHCRALALAGKGEGGLERVITCHLGAGCSIAAVLNGRCVDTSMGFTPLEGLVMGTRSGDLDPAIVHYLLSPEGGRMSDGQVYDLLNRESGLKGLSGLSADVRDLIETRAEGHEGAALALSVFNYRLKKYIAAYHGVLGGAQALVFSGGIGENSPEVRSEALEGLGPLGFSIDPDANVRTVVAEREITGEGSAVRIFVVPTDEDRMIYEEVRKLITK
ncbi:MAG: acetate/propionate family kinase [bacterium]|nr:acetate/propionate family kinase [bacterium]